MVSGASRAPCSGVDVAPTRRGDGVVCLHPAHSGQQRGLQWGWRGLQWGWPPAGLLLQPRRQPKIKGSTCLAGEGSAVPGGVHGVGVPQQGTSRQGARGTSAGVALVLGVCKNDFGGSEPEHELVPLEEPCPQGSGARRLQYALPGGGSTEGGPWPCHARLCNVMCNAVP